MKDRDQEPPTYDQLPAQLPLLSQPLPLTRRLLGKVAFESYQTHANLAVSLQQQPAEELAIVVGCGLLTFPGHDNSDAAPDTHTLVEKLMMYALTVLGISFTHAAHCWGTSDDILNTLCPDWLLMLKNVLMFKVRAAAGGQV